MCVRVNTCLGLCSLEKGMKIIPYIDFCFHIVLIIIAVLAKIGPWYVGVSIYFVGIAVACFLFMGIKHRLPGCILFYLIIVGLKLNLLIGGLIYASVLGTTYGPFWLLMVSSIILTAIEALRFSIVFSYLQEVFEQRAKAESNFYTQSKDVESYFYHFLKCAFVLIRVVAACP